MRLLLLLPLYLLLSAAAPVHQLDGGSDDITAALFSPSPTPSLSPSPLPSVSITPSADPSPTPATTPATTPDASATPEATPSGLASALASATPEPEPTASTDPAPTPSVAPSESVTVTPLPADELLPPLDDGFGDTDSEQGGTLDANDDDDDDDAAAEGGAFGFAPDSVTEEAAPKSVDGAAATAPSTISVLALVGVAVAILAPAVIIFWFVRRRSAGFQNIPRVDTDTYQGTSHGTFTVA